MDRELYREKRGKREQRKIRKRGMRVIYVGSKGGSGEAGCTGDFGSQGAVELDSVSRTATHIDPAERRRKKEERIITVEKSKRSLAPMNG